MAYRMEAVNLKKDRTEVLNFWQKNSSYWPAGKLSWFYENNIYGNADCWVVKEENSNEVVATTSIFPKRMFIRGLPLLAGITGGFAVDPKHRILGPAIQLQKEAVAKCENDHYDFLYGYPNRSSLPVQKRVGFEILGGSVRMVKVFRFRHYIQQILRSSVLAKIACFPIELSARVFGAEYRQRVPSDLKGEVIDEFDSRFDDLYRRSTGNFCLIGERSSEFLRWRFAMCPYKDYRIFTLSRKHDNSLIGYVIYDVELNNARIVDLLALDNNSMLDNVINAYCRLLRKSGLQSVSVTYLGNNVVLEKFKKFGFRKREDERNIVVYVKKNSRLSRFITDINNWYFLEGDND